MELKYLLLFLFVMGSMFAATTDARTTDGARGPVGWPPMGRKREFVEIQRDLCRAARQLQCDELEDEGMKMRPGLKESLNGH
ncbi:hypothetical protein OS493_022322 [Desmophyllum pertusum]|uniref:Uncharacterized protein n=1 Tax=Desmophyllum pertusum TaxID=174260 RepID=A0A9X0DAA8_9CNID|nr:hypothetical protein OS493_022322 [Desmophyllum pertusum]